MNALLPVGLALSGAAAYALYSRTTPHGRIMASLDAHMPDSLRRLVAYAVVNSAVDPKPMAQLAKSLAPAYPIASTVVAARVLQQTGTPIPLKTSGPALRPGEQWAGEFGPTNSFAPVPSSVANVPIFYDDGYSNPDGSRRS
jgi:hypothetical protein